MNKTRATHYLVLPDLGTNRVSNSVLPLVQGVHQMDWDVVEEDLDAEWVPQARAARELETRTQGDPDKPFGINSTDLPPGAVIIMKGERIMGLPTVDQVVAKYIETRAEIKQIEAETAERVLALKEYQDKREQWLLGELNKIGAKNVKTPHGTVYQTVKESVTMGDWDSFFTYVQETQQFNLLTHAVNKIAALEIMGEERQNALPPGVNYAAIRTVNVRKT